MSKLKYEAALEFLRQIHADEGESAILEEKTVIPKDIQGRNHPFLEDSTEKTANRKEDTQAYMLDIILPVYNMEKYVAACIRSLLKQKTKYPYQIIVIEDGSTDSSGKIVDSFGDKKEIMIVHQKNKGFSGARNAGLSLSKAPYLMFVDSDDLLPDDAVEKLLSAMIRQGADLVAGSYGNFKVFPWFRRNYLQKEGDLPSESDLSGHAWGKIYRRELFDGVHFPEKYWFEDSVMHHIIFPRAKKIVGIKDVIYQRRINLQSISHRSKGNPKSIDTVWVTLRMWEDRLSLGIPFGQSYYEYLLDQMVLNQIRLDDFVEKEAIQEAAFFLLAHKIKEYFRDYHTRIGKKTELEESIKKEDFQQFLNACNLLRRKG